MDFINNIEQIFNTTTENYTCCEHKNNQNGYCLDCNENIVEFSAQYEPDLLRNTKFNNFAYVTSYLPIEWIEFLRGQLILADVRFVNRVIIKLLPTSMTKSYIIPKLPPNKQKCLICRVDGKVYHPSKAHLHLKCQKPQVPKKVRKPRAKKSK